MTQVNLVAVIYWPTSAQRAYSQVYPSSRRHCRADLSHVQTATLHDLRSGGESEQTQCCERLRTLPLHTISELDNGCAKYQKRLDEVAEQQPQPSTTIDKVVAYLACYDAARKEEAEADSYIGGNEETARQLRHTDGKCKENCVASLVRGEAVIVWKCSGILDTSTEREETEFELREIGNIDGRSQVTP